LAKHFFVVLFSLAKNHRGALTRLDLHKFVSRQGRKGRVKLGEIAFLLEKIMFAKQITE